MEETVDQLQLLKVKHTLSNARHTRFLSVLLVSSKSFIPKTRSKFAIGVTRIFCFFKKCEVKILSRS
jgi:hypothetical protein